MVSGKDDILIDEMQEDFSESKAEPSKGLGKKLLILMAGLVLFLGVGGYLGYILLWGERGVSGPGGIAAQKTKEKTVLFSLEPFILNLSDPGRHLKVAVQFELLSKEDETKVREGTPKLRDTIIMLLSSKTTEAVSSPEGKFQLKDEILLRSNQAFNKEIFKNVYFTDFVMQ
ncbi:MAG: flagellar basal body-associated protein FliL [Thermodesulfobacteriota bacterium]